jgi:hypothetical protein
MRAFWLTFQGKPAGCVEAPSEAEARAIGEADRGTPALTCDGIPYPANPRINKHIDPKWGVCPAFCYSPERCKGRTCCPQNYSCTE